MQIPADFKKYLICIAGLPFLFSIAYSQPITGIWKGKMGNSKVELKLIRKGDSLIGTSYYYDSKSHYRRYAVKGYFDERNNDVIWWDDVLIESNGTRYSGSMSQAGTLLAVADFNCPGEGIMKLDGNSSAKTDEKKNKKELHLVKGDTPPLFPDEWDFLIENYAYGVAHPGIVDSIELISYVIPSGDMPEQPSVAIQPDKVPSRQTSPSVIEKQETIKQESQVIVPLFIPPSVQTNEERFTSRTKILQQVIPVKGDSIELKFYDNAEIDGDSIAVFLNGHLLQEHILLSEHAYVMKIALSDLQTDNELVMVAENLGTIPPNTSLMVAVVEEKRFEAHLQSTEGSSALVRLVKP